MDNINLQTKKFFLYARKSTEEEERQALSIPAQITELREYARKENSEIQELIDDLQPIKKAFDAVTNENLTDDQVRAIAIAVESLRTKLIS